MIEFQEAIRQYAQPDNRYLDVSCVAEDLIPRLLSLREPVQQLDNQKVEVAVNMPVQSSGPTGRWTPGIWRRQAPNLTSATDPSEDLDSTTGQAAPLQPDQPGAGGSYQFMLSGVRSTLQNASRWGSFVSEAPQRLWHKRKLVQVRISKPQEHLMWQEAQPLPSSSILAGARSLCLYCWMYQHWGTA